MAAAISVTKLRKTFISPSQPPVVALADVSLAVQGATVTAIVGPSGSGKSTLLHLLGAIDRPDKGTILVGGTEVTTLREDERVKYRRNVGFVFQHFHLLPALSVVENVAAPLLPRRQDFDVRLRATDLLRLVGLDGRERDLPTALSGGEQQRVAIARAMISRPHILLADEPTGNLDSATGEAIMELMLDLSRTRSVTVLIATHDNEVSRRCDQVIALRDGRRVS